MSFKQSHLRGRLGEFAIRENIYFMLEENCRAWQGTTVINAECGHQGAIALAKRYGRLASP